jgi:bifunctional DNA-binding transcriptional regulator/antitoxin component of YhaV-PrlF toxin-antitoxin module
MATLKLHFDGWLPLPVAFRRKLGLTAGDVLEAELKGGTIVLRPVAGKAAGRPAPDEVEAAAAEPQPAATAPAPTPPPAGRRKTARTAPAPLIKSRGRRRPKEASLPA